MVFLNSYWYGIGILLGIVGVGIWYLVRVKQRQKVAKGVLGLGNLVGRHYSAFTAAMGSPTNVEKTIAKNTGEWVKIATWRAGGYEIIIMFDKDDVFNRIVSESRYSSF